MDNTALVIIDVQNAVLSVPGMMRTAETMAAYDACVARIASLLTRARRSNIPVLFVQHDGTMGQRLERGSLCWQIRPELMPDWNEPVLHKAFSDSFFQTTLDAELRSRKISGLIVAGGMTPYCIATSLRRAVTLGYDVMLVADGHMTTDSGALTFNQIIAHRNELLDGFDAGEISVARQGNADRLPERSSEAPVGARFGNGLVGFG